MKPYQSIYIYDIYVYDIYDIYVYDIYIYMRFYPTAPRKAQRSQGERPLVRVNPSSLNGPTGSEHGTPCCRKCVPTSKFVSKFRQTHSCETSCGSNTAAFHLRTLELALFFVVLSRKNRSHRRVFSEACSSRVPSTGNWSKSPRSMARMGSANNLLRRHGHVT